jgi:hypothetical protein
MKHAVLRAGERLLGLFLPSVEAGACIPEHGQCCRCHHRFDCVGNCIRNNNCTVGC